MDRGLQHHAGLRGSDVDPTQLVFGRDLALDELTDLVVGLAQILGDLADHILVDLNDLQFGLGDLALGLRLRCNVLRPLAGQPGRVALQHRQTRNLNQVLFVQRANADQFLLHQRNFLVFRLFLRAQACDLLVQLRDPFAQLRLLSGPSIDTNLEQFGFARDDGLDIGVLGPREQHLRKYDLVEAPLFGL